MPPDPPPGFFLRAPVSEGTPSPLLADNIDPATRDFADLFVGVDPIDAQVQLAVTTIRGSGAAVLEDGITITPTKMGDSYRAQLLADARAALARLVRNGDVRLLGVELLLDDQGNQTSLLGVQYVNLRAVDGSTRRVVAPTPGVTK